MPSRMFISSGTYSMTKILGVITAIFNNYYYVKRRKYIPSTAPRVSHALSQSIPNPLFTNAERCLAQGETTRNRQSWDSNPDLSDAKAGVFTRHTFNVSQCLTWGLRP